MACVDGGQRMPSESVRPTISRWKRKMDEHWDSIVLLHPPTPDAEEVLEILIDIEGELRAKAMKSEPPLWIRRMIP
jgi:hypothetical protein